MDKMDEGLKTLLDLGKRRGFLTFDQVNDFLPDGAARRAFADAGERDVRCAAQLEKAKAKLAEIRI